MTERFFISAIGTDSGKTIISALLCNLLKADYWKPVQTGGDAMSDYRTVASLTRDSKIHPSVYVYQDPVAPTQAAITDDLPIDIYKLRVPNHTEYIIIEGAGGLMVPVTDKVNMADLASIFKSRIILVINYYLGSINHTLLSLHFLEHQKIPVAGIVLCGEPNDHTRDIIIEHSPYKILLEVPHLNPLNHDTLAEYAASINKEKFLQSIKR